MSDSISKKATKSSGNESIFLRVVNNNKAISVISLVIAVICWVVVTMFQSAEIEKNFTVKVQLNLEDGMPNNYGLTLFGEKEYSVDVTVKGKSYLLNDSSFADKITVSGSLVNVSSPGNYQIPLKGDLERSLSKEAEITYLSKTSISLYFDKVTEKTFDLVAEVNDNVDGYSLPEGYVRENPLLNVSSVKLSGPSLEINKIASVKAYVELDKEITENQILNAEIIPVGSSENFSFPNVKAMIDEPVKVTVNVNYVGEYIPVVTFTSVPEVYKDKGVEYKLTPEKVSAKVPVSETEMMISKEISVGTIDFSKIDQVVNYIKIKVDESPYEFLDGVTEFTAVVDMSKMDKQWRSAPVSVEGIKLPANATVLTTEVLSVQIIGPKKSVEAITANELVAVPVLDNITLVKGINKVPAKITLRTLKDSWVRGDYTIDIEVK